jgi:hypothetical protein
MQSSISLPLDSHTGPRSGEREERVTFKLLNSSSVYSFSVSWKSLQGDSSLLFFFCLLLMTLVVRSTLCLSSLGGLNLLLDVLPLIEWLI